MTPYLFLISIPFLALPFYYRYSYKFNKYYIFTYSFILFIFIGFRDKTGGDWQVYLNNFKFYGENFSFFLRSDIGYELLSYLVYSTTGNFYVLNIIIGLFNIFCLYKFIIQLKNPVLAFFVSLPLIILILFMGFIRQGIAFSFLLLALTYIKNSNLKTYYLLIVIGILFHKSLIFFLILGIFIDKKIIFKILIFFLSIFILLFFFKDIVSLYDTYLGKYKGVYYDASRGATVRIALNLIPAIFLLSFRNKFKANINEKSFYVILSFVLLLMFLIKDLAITFVDRFNYYLIILQLYVFGNLENFNFENKNIIIIFKYFILFSYIFIYLFWLIYANHRIGWLPYKNILFNA